MFTVYSFFSLYLFISPIIEAEDLETPASDFRRHRIVQPIAQHVRTKREIITTRDESGAHHSEVTMKVPVDGEEYILDLRLNEDLLTDNHILRYKENGKTVLHKPTKNEIDLCHYSGSVRNKRGSWVAVSTCHGVQGIVFDGQKMRYIEPAQGGDISSKHYMYDHADLSESYHCGYLGGVTTNSSYDPHLYHKYHAEKKLQKSRVSRYKRNSANDHKIHEPYNVKNKVRYVELVLVADYKEYMANYGDLRKVYHKMKMLANIINSFYVPLNIFIALVGVVVWNEHDEIQLDKDSNKTLANFLSYRKTAIVDIPNDNAHLLTRQKFLEGVVGKAYVGKICTYESSGGVETVHSEVIGLFAATIAHEMGHNFGMNHDDDELCKCPDQKCFMSPSSTSVTPVHWSSCSLNSLALSFAKGMDYCLRNKPKRLFNSPTCGNGFVEPGEQCDCGTMSVPGAYNPCHACCEPSSCMLRANATCGAGVCCDLKTCRPKSAGTVCRSADSKCDLPEYCTGHSEYCPDDLYKMDTTPCGKDGQTAYCVRGGCRSHTDQCRLLWGPTGKSIDTCYEKNREGIQNANCGYDRIHKTYLPCNQENVMCGTLHCQHLNSHIEFGSTYLETDRFKFTNDAAIACSAVEVDMGLNDVDPGLVPDGAKCGNGKMCLKQKCVSVDAVRQIITKGESSLCPSKCSGHGVCNSAGQCHCDPGFAPPLCALPGPGGSYSSGPATDPTHAKKVMIAMYIIFLDIVPLIVIILCLINYFYPMAILRCNGSVKKILKFCNCHSKNSNELQTNEACEHNPTTESTKLEDWNNKSHSPMNQPIYANYRDLRDKKYKIVKPPLKINKNKDASQAAKLPKPERNINKDTNTLPKQKITKDVIVVLQENNENDVESNDSIYVNQFASQIAPNHETQTHIENKYKGTALGKPNIVKKATVNTENINKDIESTMYINKDYHAALQSPSMGPINPALKNNKVDNQITKPRIRKEDIVIISDNINEKVVESNIYANTYVLKPGKLARKDNKQIDCKINVNDIQMAKNKIDNRKGIKNKLILQSTERENVLPKENGSQINVKDLVSTMNNMVANNEHGMAHNSTSGPSGNVFRNNLKLHGPKK